MSFDARAVALGLVAVLGLVLLIAVVVLELWFFVLWAAVLLAVQLAAFAVYALIYGRIEPPEGSASVVALGCGLGPGGSVTPLLASRLDRALGVYNGQLDAGSWPALIVSGGQGTDESVAEATAMKQYLAARGVAEAKVFAETESRNTRENLVYSKELLDSAGLTSEPMIVVTSDFHVLRTAGLTRDLGINAHVTGARAARTYSRKAFLREFAAVLQRYWKVNAVLLVGILAFVVFLQNVNG
ncbi:YdcF family protein [Rhodococcus sp. PAMC28707]|uniref:YdcF family protein n=1 Tax=unclassified Rhodococcus (in: high G+C Gram-positive bacteria) TaxID=192944 RepID=UPI00109DA788|nr:MULTISPECIES: YdcF family protein [unclassified Rhodococcus (in: high G+C Gram-positive bacteria)]QCB49885.1 YdcF family protein [Rhodococcus sp. PAMC28705]QCB58422.1 YdcF family protein [Rhodococcus sp. PAMC28707]